MTAKKSKKAIAATVVIPEMLKSTQVKANIVKIGNHFNSAPMLKLLAETSVQCLLHAQAFGDVTLCKALYDSLGGGKSVIRGNAMKTWFGLMGPIVERKNKETGETVWGLKKDHKPEDWKIELALSKPFWEYMGEEKVNYVSADELLKVIKGLVRRAESAHEKGTFKGEYEKTMSTVNNVVSFAEAQFQKLSLKDRGQADVTAEVILKAASK